MQRNESTKRAVVLGALLMACLVVAGPVSAQDHAEIGDAGDLPATAQAIGTSVTIYGSVGSDDADVYRVCLAGGKTFSASTNPEDSGYHGFDTQLFLFDEEGRGVYGNDNIQTGQGSRLPAGDALTPEEGGVFYLAISRFNKRPVDSTNAEIFSMGDIQTPVNDHPIAGWSSLPFIGGGYRIVLTGTVDCAADLRLQKTASSTTVTVGDELAYLFTVTNHGPLPARNVTIGDDLPAQVTFVSCTASGGGSCVSTPAGFNANFASIPSGESRTATLIARLDPATPDGTVVKNVAAVDSDTLDPNPTNNGAGTSFMAMGAPHALRFYLHGNDIPGTAGGYTMNLTPPSPPVTLGVNLLNAPRWNSDPVLDGTFQAGNFRLRVPCTLGIGVITTYALHRVDADGSNSDRIGDTTQPLTLCFGQRTIDIPVATAEMFDGQRLQLVIASALGLNVNLSLDSNLWLDTTLFTGTP